ncbi:translational GTPase TypA [Candidatus Berkiella cookevillensis]|uniref:Large ribosomal subunit assembly factor BipA n=1 Tax=Candidatus Berkiella cookevillensis TaxID=437022 RepID=A0A0Q9YRW2_9GAMM|nr:translational GTPase TypA [Candidatus Berkiella cookevillensis]MCS5709606.1 translational GTPase TypA [Candidatus Berkiella cookevillensis]
MTLQLKNIAIIAHVDHGKTTMIDKLLQQSGSLGRMKGADVQCVMDSNDLEKERGITILSKNTAIVWNGYHINIVDTPGHADFGGEVERVLSMVDSVLLLVDAVDGPMPQTRFVTQKAFAQGLNPIVVINKIDRPGARPSWVIDQVFDLFDKLGATDEQLDFPVVYCSGLEGTATLDLSKPGKDLNPLFETILEKVPAPKCEPNGTFQMQISSLDYTSYVGTIGVGRVQRGSIKPNTPVVIVDSEGKRRQGKVLQILGYLGLKRVEIEEARAGDIVAITGINPLSISDTVCDPSNVEALPPLVVDQPTMSIMFLVNKSPFCGKEGEFLTSRQIRDRLARECVHNVALKVEETEDPDKFKVSGRGELHLTILMENMRREGYEFAVSRPEVIIHEGENGKEEPYEFLTIDIEETHQGRVMEVLGERKGDLQNMVSDGKGRVRLDYIVPSRALIGFHTNFLTITSGTGLATHVFDHYGPYKEGVEAERNNGVLISMGPGKAAGYALFNLQPRGRLFIGPQTEVYEGMIVGLHTRSNDLIVNVTRGKQLTNMRASGSDENIVLTPPVKFSLEQGLEFLNDDELLEVTPKSIRLRKKFLKEHERKRSSKE